jgi:hypothetical protein
MEGPARGCTEGARERKTRRLAATSDGRKQAWLREIGLESPLPTKNGKEGVSGSSPEEGLETTPVNRGVLLFPQATADGAEGARGCTPGFASDGTHRPQTGALRQAADPLSNKEWVDGPRRPEGSTKVHREPAVLRLHAVADPPLATVEPDEQQDESAKQHLLRREARTVAD